MVTYCFRCFRSLDSPSNSLEAVSGRGAGEAPHNGGAPPWDSDTEADVDSPPDWKTTVPDDVLKTLSEHEIKRQEVINGECDTGSRDHVANYSCTVSGHANLVLTTLWFCTMYLLEDLLSDIQQLHSLSIGGEKFSLQPQHTRICTQSLTCSPKLLKMLSEAAMSYEKSDKCLWS